MCTIDKIFDLIQSVIDYALIIIVPLAVISIAIGGIMMITAAGDEGRLKTGRSILGYALWGLVLALGAYLIVKAIFVGLGVAPNFLPF